jgi:hypothetical protein
LSADALKLLVLIPHRDSRLLLRAWSSALFGAGCEGAWSFPWAAPLAALARFFTGEELRRCARALREQTVSRGGDGKIKTGPACRAAFPAHSLADGEGGAAVFGPVLDLEIPDCAFTPNAAAKIIYRFSPTVLGAALTGPFQKGAARPEIQAFSFRAAALANMLYRPLPSSGGDSFEWRIGKLCWLPPLSGKKGQRDG